MNILKKIVAAKRAELQALKSEINVASLEKSSYFTSPTRSLEKAINDKKGYGIIAEFKKMSPSKGLINASALPEVVCPGYLQSGASAVSVLTNREFFAGCNEDLLKARALCEGPILRKEFIIDEYQVIESKSIGADAILLIADILDKSKLKSLSLLAESLNMEVLFEIHDEEGIGKLPENSKLTGINSRNLENFVVDTGILARIVRMLPESSIKIAESGINSASIVPELRKSGFGGFLIGELFMKENDPASACKNFIEAIKTQGMNPHDTGYQKNL